jgi:lipoate-protein ligase A
LRGERWRFVDSGARPGAENMAVDEAMFEAHAAGECSPTLRVYGWRPRAVSLGRFQRAESSVDLEACRRLGVDVVRRPTGGRAILHTEQEVTFSVVVSGKRLGTTGVMDSYRALAGGIVAGLRRLGAEARLVERTGSGARPGGAQDPACFAVKARCDLAVGSSKLVGSAQVQRDGFILQQNSLPLRVDVGDWEGVFRRGRGAPEAVGLWDAAGREVSYSEAAEALREGFAEAFGVEFGEEGLSDWELARAREVAAEAAVGAETGGSGNGGGE